MQFTHLLILLIHVLQVLYPGPKFANRIQRRKFVKNTLQESRSRQLKYTKIIEEL